MKRKAEFSYLQDMNNASEIKTLKLTNIQKVIGRRMEQSKRCQPCFYMGIVADITELNSLRRRASKQLKTRLSTNDFFFKAISTACLEFPLMAGRLRGDNIEISASINIGFAVSAAGDKLLVPVIKGADKMGIAEIAAQSQELTQIAKSGKITPEQMSEPTIVLSSLGMFGISEFIAVLPLDMPSIIAIGKPQESLTPKDGKYEPRKLISLTLSADGRIVNSDYAARFLQLTASYLENPIALT